MKKKEERRRSADDDDNLSRKKRETRQRNERERERSFNVKEQQTRAFTLVVRSHTRFGSSSRIFYEEFY